MEKYNCSRREFLKRVGTITAGFAVATYLSVPTTIYGKQSRQLVLQVDLTAEENCPLLEVGRAIWIKNPQDKKRKIILYRENEGEVKAFSDRCTHKGGPVILGKKGEWICKWHKAEFNKKGAAIKKPAKAPLEEFEATLEESIISILL